MVITGFHDVSVYLLIFWTLAYPTPSLCFADVCLVLWPEELSSQLSVECFSGHVVCSYCHFHFFAFISIPLKFSSVLKQLNYTHRCSIDDRSKLHYSTLCSMIPTMVGAVNVLQFLWGPFFVKLMVFLLIQF